MVLRKMINKIFIMDNTNKAKLLGILGITLCGLCCALPIISAAVGMASLTAIGAYLDNVGIAALGLAGFFLWYGWYTKRKKAKASGTNSCDTSCECKTESITSS